MTKEETIQVLKSIEDRAVEFPNMTECDWVAIAAAKRHLQEEPISEALEKAIDTYLKSYWDSEKEKQGWPFLKKMVIYFAKWQKEHLWKPADGEELPEIDREVVVFTQDFPNDAGIMSVAIAHRPNPDGWDGKSIATGEVEHYTPKTYDKGGWNIPDVKWWLDCQIPKMGEDLI